MCAAHALLDGHVGLPHGGAEAHRRRGQPADVGQLRSCAGRRTHAGQQTTPRQCSAQGATFGAAATASACSLGRVHFGDTAPRSVLTQSHPLAGRATCDRRMRVRSAEIQGPNHRPVTTGSGDGAATPRRRESGYQDGIKISQAGIKMASRSRRMPVKGAHADLRAATRPRCVATLGR